MAATVISAKYPPHIDITKTPLAYGDRALPRLNRELSDKTLLTRQRAVMSLCDYLHDPEHIASALREGIAQSLKMLLSDKDKTIRTKSTECLYIMATHAIGRDAFLDEGIIVPLSKLFDDKEDIVRQNAHQAIEMCSETPVGAEGIVEAKLIPILVEKLETELDNIKELILDTLHFCMKMNTEDALNGGAMEVFTTLLKHKSAKIRASAAKDIMGLSVPLAGKDKAVEVKCVPVLVRLLQDEEADVRASAAGALMIITITTKGKYTAIQSGCIEPLVELVDDPISAVRANSLKSLTCIAEAPEGREALQKHIDRLKVRTADPIPAVVKAAQIAVKMVAWKP